MQNQQIKEKIKEKIKEFFALVQSYWETSKVTMLSKPVLYIFTVVVAAFRTDLTWLAILGVVGVFIDFIANTYENKKFEEKIGKLKDDKKKSS